MTNPVAVMTETGVKFYSEKEMKSLPMGTQLYATHSPAAAQAGEVEHDNRLYVAAVRTLQNLGYHWDGGEVWAPRVSTAQPKADAGVSDATVFDIFKKNCVDHPGNYEVTPGQALAIARALRPAARREPLTKKAILHLWRSNYRDWERFGRALEAHYGIGPAPKKAMAELTLVQLSAICALCFFFGFIYGRLSND